MKRILVISILLLKTVFAFEAVQPLPTTVKYDRAKAELGKILFHDPSLSKDGKVSCATCHDLYTKCGTDQKPVSTGFAGKRGTVNSPTVFNAVFNFRQFWNGRAADLREQLMGPITNPVEMNTTPEEIEKKLNNSQFYRKKFKEVYNTSRITFEQFAEAIVEFEKALITPNSKFDRYLQGLVRLSPEEEEGFKLFKKLGCISCHNGVNLGGNSFQKLGIVVPYNWKPTNPDRYQITKREEDKNVYKVPTLRNITCTYPYFHDGSVADLKKTISLMARYNLGIDITDEEIEKIIAFLETLKGELPPILTEERK